MMPLLLALHLGAGVIALCAGRRVGRWTTAIALVPWVTAAVTFGAAASDVLDGRTPASSWTWVRSLSVTASSTQLRAGKMPCNAMQKLRVR